MKKKKMREACDGDCGMCTNSDDCEQHLGEVDSEYKEVVLKDDVIWGINLLREAIKYKNGLIYDAMRVILHTMEESVEKLPVYWHEVIVEKEK